MSISRYDLEAISILIGTWVLCILIALGFIALKVWIIISVYQWMVS